MYIEIIRTKDHDDKIVYFLMVYEISGARGCRLSSYEITDLLPSLETNDIRLTYFESEKQTNQFHHNGTFKNEFYNETIHSFMRRL